MNVPRFFPLAVAAACLFCGGLARADAPIETATVTRVAVAARHVAEGVVEAVSAATLGAQVPGRIVDVKVDAGDPVTRGQVLMRIDASAAEQSVAVAAANVASASAALANARAEWQRTEALFAQKYISQARVDQARAALRAAEAGYRAAQAGRGEAVVARDFTTITAPFDGVVAARLVDAGDMAQPGRALVSVYAPAAMRVVAQVAQSVVGRAGRDGIGAEIEVPGRALNFSATRVQVLPAADPRTQTVEVRASVPAELAGLVPGQFARLHLHVGEAARLSVAASAILRRGEITAVYVHDGARFRLRQVRPGERLPDGQIEVLAGVVAGDVVALDPVRAGLQRTPEHPQ